MGVLDITEDFEFKVRDLWEVDKVAYFSPSYFICWRTFPEPTYRWSRDNPFEPLQIYVDIINDVHTMMKDDRCYPDTTELLEILDERFSELFFITPDHPELVPKSHIKDTTENHKPGLLIEYSRFVSGSKENLIVQINLVWRLRKMTAATITLKQNI